MENRYFMAGVATAYLYKGNDLFATAKTLTESSINIGNSAEDVRGGEGAGLLGKYYHTSTFDLTLTDALFNLGYLSASVGAAIKAGADVLMEEKVTAAAGGAATLSHTPVAMTDCEKAFVSYRKTDADKWSTKEATEADITLPEAGDYCVKYFYNNASASKITVEQNFIPDTFLVVLKENLYAAGANSSNKTKVGHIEITIPRFQLDGAQDLSMSMTGAATTSLKGSALVAEGCSEDCDQAGYYATIAQIIDGAVWADEITGIAVDGGAVKAGEDAKIYALYNDKLPQIITADMLTVKVSDDETITFKFKDSADAEFTGITAPAGVAAGALKLYKGDTVIATTAITVA